MYYGDYDDFDDDETGYEEIGRYQSCPEDHPEMATVIDEMAGEEVGRLFRRGSKKRRRRILGAIFGGPIGAIAALGSKIKQRRRRRREERALERALPGPKAPQTDGDRLVVGEERLEPFGFTPVELPPAAPGPPVVPTTGTLEETAQQPFQPRRLVLASALGLDAILVTDLKIGTRSQLASIGPLPAALFANVSEDVRIQFDAVRTGQDVTIELSNSNPNSAVTVAAAYMGVTTR